MSVFLKTFRKVVPIPQLQGDEMQQVVKEFADWYAYAPIRTPLGTRWGRERADDSMIYWIEFMFDAKN